MIEWTRLHPFHKNNIMLLTNGLDRNFPHEFIVHFRWAKSCTIQALYYRVLNQNCLNSVDFRTFITIILKHLITTNNYKWIQMNGPTVFKLPIEQNYSNFHPGKLLVKKNRVLPDKHLILRGYRFMSILLSFFIVLTFWSLFLT